MSFLLLAESWKAPPRLIKYLKAIGCFVGKGNREGFKYNVIYIFQMYMVIELLECKLTQLRLFTVENN